MSLNKPQIKLLRGNSDKLMNSKIRLSANQPLYIKDKNYLLIGNDSELKSTKPITVPFVKGWIMDWQATNNDWSISTDTDEISSYYFGPNPRSTGGVSLDAKDHFELSLSPINQTPDTGIVLDINRVSDGAQVVNSLTTNAPINTINSKKLSINTFESLTLTPKDESSTINIGACNIVIGSGSTSISYGPGSGKLFGRITNADFSDAVMCEKASNSVTFILQDAANTRHTVKMGW